VVAALAASGHRWAIGALVAASVAVAERGRRRFGGTAVFPFSCSLFAPMWIAERGVCAWLAVASHVCRGGVTYRGRIVSRAATRPRELQARFRGTR